VLPFLQWIDLQMIPFPFSFSEDKESVSALIRMNGIWIAMVEYLPTSNLASNKNYKKGIF